MPKFIVTWECTAFYETVIEAKDREEAEQKHDELSEDEIAKSLDWTSYNDGSLEIVEVKE